MGRTNHHMREWPNTLVVGALATLDYDESVGRIQAKEQIKNYVLQQSAKLWDDFLKECADDPDLAHIAAAYFTHRAHTKTTTNGQI